MKKAVIFLNGKLPDKKIINNYIDRNSYIVAADGGANNIVGMNFIPNVIIGDLDSVSKDTLDHFKGKCDVIHITEQESTDFEKCMRFCDFNKFDKMYIFGATSMRPDHTMNNFSILRRYYKKMNIVMITDEYEIFFIDKLIKFNYPLNEVVSMMPLPKAYGIITDGLVYKLENEDLEFGTREGTLNRSNKKSVVISFSAGDLLLFKKHFN